jgi:hypothetical protein
LYSWADGKVGAMSGKRMNAAPRETPQAIAAVREGRVEPAAACPLSQAGQSRDHGRELADAGAAAVALHARTAAQLYDGEARWDAIARLKPGVTLESARSEIVLLAEQSRQAYPKENENTGATLVALPALLTGDDFFLLHVGLGLGRLLRQRGRRRDHQPRA